MPDIRSYFTSSKAPSSKPSKSNGSESKESGKKGSKRYANIDDDDDVIPESPQIGKKESKKRFRALSSSDEESNTQSKSKNIKTNATTKTQEKSRNKSKSPKKPERVNVAPSDFFGKAPVKRVMPSESKETVSAKKTKTEVGIHDDDDFEKTLIELDENADKKSDSKNESKKQNGNASKTPTKNESHSSKTKEKSDKKDSSADKKDTSKKSTDKIDSANDSSRKRTRSNSKTPQKVDKTHSDKSPREKQSKIDLGSAEKRKEDKKKVENDAKVKRSNLDKKLAISEKLHGKKDFSMFIDDSPSPPVKDDTVVIEAVSPKKEKPSSHKITTPKSESKSTKQKATPKQELTDEERQERRRQSFILYKNYQNRSGPKNHGAKEIPEGTPHCLAGLVFLVTGVLDSFEKEEIEEAVRKYGGDFKKSMSGKVTHLICGEDAGPAKMAQAEKQGTTILSEDEFLQLIKDFSEKKQSKGDDSIKKDATTDKKKIEPIKKEKTVKVEKEEVKKQDKVKTERVKKEESVEEEVKSEFFAKDVKKEDTKVAEEIVSVPVKTDSGSSVTSLGGGNIEDVPWVEKYKPKTLKQIIGQQGDKSNVNKLMTWLSEWYASRKKNLPKPNPWAGDKQGGGYYKAALLSGPPGVGKTTTVGLVCKELGFDTVEFNASDTRSKTLLKEHLADLVSSNSLSGFYHGNTGKGAVSKKHVVIMDEVDGMAGNEDRGGMQELLSLIKTTSVPIVCMCNDKTSPKMRSLASNCYDLTFSRPRVDQIKGAMLSVCFKEGIKISPQALSQMISSSNQDIRQVLNLLSVWSAASKTLTAEGVERDSNQAHKDMKLGPWDVVRKVFSQEEHKTMSIHDKSDLFFHDYSLGPLFVQQNYLKVAPKCDKKEVLDRFAEAAESLSIGDVVESKIRSNMAWSLLPLQAMFSSVIPGSLLEGHMTGQIDFPSWLGQNSKTNKMSRLAQELHSHTSLSTSGSKQAIRLDYAGHLRDAIINPLVKQGSDGVQDSISVLQEYHLLREDLDSLMELTHWSGQRDPYSMVETKVKTALTRTYNKEAAPLPYSNVSMKKSKSTVSSGDSDMMSQEMESQDVMEEEEENDSDVEHDAMIKAKVSKASSSNSKKGSSSTSSSKSTSKDGNAKNRKKK